MEAPPDAVLEAPENLNVLLQSDFWREAGFLGLDLVLGVVWGGVLWFVVGLVAGYVLYRVIRAAKLIHLEARWYRYVRWIWAPLCMLSLAIGLGYGGLWMGGYKSIREAIEERGVIRRAVANVYTAVALDQSDHQLEGDEDIEQIVRLFEDAPALVGQGRSNLSARVDAVYVDKSQDPGIGRAQRWIFGVLANTRVEDMIVEKLAVHLGDAADDPEATKYFWQLATLYLVDREAYAAYTADHPEFEFVAAIIQQVVSKAENEATKWARRIAKGNLVVGGLTAAAIPLGLAGVFRLLVWLAGRIRKDPPDDADPAPAPV